VEPFRYHVFVCTQEKAEGVPCCSVAGSFRVLNALHGELGAKGLADEVQVSSCGCLGVCDSGPVMIVYPEGTWYTKLTAGDVPEIVASHFQAGQKVARLARNDYAEMKAEILDHRNKYLAMLKAKDAAGVLPDDVSELIRGFMPSRAVLTALELDMFTAVGKGGTAQQIAAKIQTAVRGTEMLLNALVTLNLLEKRDGVYSNTPMSARFFVEGTPDSARTAQLHIANLWKRWSTLTDAVRAGTSVAPRGENGWVTPFIAAMDHTARGRARAVVQAVELNGENANALYFASTIHLYFCSGRLELSDPDCHLSDAEAYVRRALQVNDAFREAKNTLGQILILEKRYPEAIAVLEKLAEEHINVEYAYASTDSAPGKSLGIFHTSNPKRALKILLDPAGSNGADRSGDRRPLHSR